MIDTQDINKLIIKKGGSMNDPRIDKAMAEKEKMQAKIAELKAQLKIAAADVRIGIQQQIDALQAKINAYRN
jgi:hypothetical protein